jgi:hypothetical protein
MPDVKRFGRSVLSGMVAQWANWLLAAGAVGLYTVWRGPLDGVGPSLETVGWGVVIVAMVLVVLFQLPSDRKRAAATNAVAPFDRTEVPRPWADDLGDRSTDEEWRQSALEEIKRQEELLSPGDRFPRIHWCAARQRNLRDRTVVGELVRESRPGSWSRGPYVYRRRRRGSDGS